MSNQKHNRNASPWASHIARGCLPLALAMAGMTLLGGCATSSGPLHIYDLGTAQTARAPKLRHHIDVSLPTAILPYDSDRMVIRTGPDSIAYLHGSQWVDGLPRLLQARIRDSLENAGGAAASHTGLGDETLKITIRRFEVDVTQGLAVVSLSVRLVSTSSEHLIAGRIIRATAPAPNHGGEAMAAALDEAAGKAMHQIVLIASAGG